MLQFCKDMLEGADVDGGNVRVGVVSYSTEAEVQFNLNTYLSKSRIFDAIDEIAFIPGSTNTADAIRAARRMFTKSKGDRLGVDNVIMLLTDGISNINSQKTIPEARRTHSEGIHIYAIGIGLTDTHELDAIASEPASENSFAVRTFEELEDLSESLFISICPGKCESTHSYSIGVSFIFRLFHFVFNINERCLSYCHHYRGALSLSLSLRLSYANTILVI